MVKIPGRFERVAAAFDEVARVWSCETIGSQQSIDLSHLVNSFIEREIPEQSYEFDDEGESNESPHINFKCLFDLQNDAIRRSIHAEVEVVYRQVGASSPDFKRRLTDRLRSRGFDAGICKSKNGRGKLGSYEYVDVEFGGARYIVEVLLAGTLTIARPTIGYASLLEKIPEIYVGKAEELKQVVTVMCKAIGRSMKSVGIHVPPWRRLHYMHSKWFAFYERTTDDIPTPKDRNIMSEKQGLGVEGISFHCREEFSGRSGVRIGNLSAAFKTKQIML